MNSKNIKILIMALVVVVAFLVQSSIVNLYQRQAIVQQDKQIAVMSEEKTKLEEQVESFEIDLLKERKKKELDFFKDYIKDNFDNIFLTVEAKPNVKWGGTLVGLIETSGTHIVYVLTFYGYLDEIKEASGKWDVGREPTLYSRPYAATTKEFLLLSKLADYLSVMKNGQKFRKEEKKENE